MDWPAPESEQRLRESRDDGLLNGETEGAHRELEVFGVIADRLESDPEECWIALEGLAALDLESRLAILDALPEHDRSPGVEMLLHLMSTGCDSQTREAALAALARTGGTASRRAVSEGNVRAAAPGGLAVRAATRCSVEAASSTTAIELVRPRLLHCLVTPLDGQGHGSIVISSGAISQRRTAAFRCDVERGICDIMGVVEPESPAAGGLLAEIDGQTSCDVVRDVPELALGLLAGCLALCGPEVARPVSDWLAGTLGPSFQPLAFPATIDGLHWSSTSGAELPRRVDAVLDRCPSWLDLSPLTFDLAQEILLRQGKPAADPARDAGAYRFLFEHRLIHRLELYRRMLLWMAWLWKCADEAELAESAFSLGSQLSDDQYAVPSHPFMAGLTTRSLLAAQEILGATVAQSTHRSERAATETT
jgi:hypothetical protein